MPPIPVFDIPAGAGSYHSVPFDFDDPRAADPLVKAGDYGLACDNFYARTDGSNLPYGEPIAGTLKDVWCRRLAAEKLVRVNGFLRDYGVELLIYDAYRPVACQQGLWDFFMNKAGRDRPGASEQEKSAWVVKYISDPTRFAPQDPASWPVHISGASVDVTLREKATGKELDMGAGFDDMGVTVHGDYLERLLAEGGIAPDHGPLLHRRLLRHAMTGAGFVNHPREYWHFDWGNQMHVFHAGLQGLENAPKKAWFGYIEPPEYSSGMK